MPRTIAKIIKFRNYCFTINNYSEEEFNALKEIKCQYLVCGKEIGEQGTPHLQGYVYFKGPKTLACASKCLPRAHLEPAKGTADQNYAYCTKEGNFIEIGTRPKSQKEKGEMEKERWSNIINLAESGNLEQLKEEDPQVYLKHYRTLQAIQKDHAPMPANADGTTGIWYYGPSGSGKSRKAREENPDAYLKMCNKWWDGYHDEEVVLIEDLDQNHGVLGHHLKIWADRYAFPAEIKGGKINIRPKKIIVTSNYHPMEIWADKGTLEPILRRFEITKIDFPSTLPVPVELPEISPARQEPITKEMLEIYMFNKN